MIRNAIRSCRLTSNFVQIRNYAAHVPKVTPYGKFSYENLQIEKAEKLKPHPEEKSLTFASVFTDHMLTCEWDINNGWDVPKIVPFQNISLPPSATVFHYALECFEGMKAYSGIGRSNGETLLFRPEMNMERFNRSCKRIALPTINVQEAVKCIAKLVDLDKSWIPKRKGFSMYLRPTMISTEPSLGVGPAKKALFFTILAPSGPYYPKGFKPVRLLADPTFVRAFPGGTGEYKLGANYAGTVMPAILAAQKGYDQICWLTGKNHQITEVGAMNLLFYMKNKEGVAELVTAKLEDGLVLPGVTRDSILSICRTWGINVNECSFTIHDVIDAIKEGRMIEVFGAGTAAIVSPVNCISYKDVDYEIPTPENGLTHRLFNYILSIQHGEEPSVWSANIKEYI